MFILQTTVKKRLYVLIIVKHFSTVSNNFFYIQPIFVFCLQTDFYISHAHIVLFLHFLFLFWIGLDTFHASFLQSFFVFLVIFSCWIFKFFIYIHTYIHDIHIKTWYIYIYIYIYIYVCMYYKLPSTRFLKTNIGTMSKGVTLRLRRICDSDSILRSVVQNAKNI